MPHAMSDAGGDHVVVGRVLLQHEPHRAHIVPGKAPITLHVKIPHAQLLLQPELDARHAMTDSSGYKLDPAAGRFVVKQDAGAGKEIVALPSIDGDPVPIELGDTVGAAGIEPRALVLGRLFCHAEHFARRSLIKTDGWIHHSDRLQHPRYTERRELAGEHRLAPGGRHKRLRGEVIDLLRFSLVEGREQRALIEQISRDQFDSVLKMSYAFKINRAAAAHQAIDGIAFLQKEFGEIGTVLSGYSGDEGVFGHKTGLSFEPDLEGIVLRCFAARRTVTSAQLAPNLMRYVPRS